MSTDQVAHQPSSSLPEPVTAPLHGEWAPPAEGWAGVPPTAGDPTIPGGGSAPGSAAPDSGRWTGKKVIAAVALTAALAGGAGFGIGMAVDSGGSSTQQGGPGGGGFPGGGNGGPGGGFGNQQQGSTSQQDGTGTTQQGTGTVAGTTT
jgi:hypothetical protein